jgi:hypothetical protein
MSRRVKQSGASMLEFVFVGIPLIFVLISIFEISRGMWIYVTLAHGVKEAVRFSIVHGNNCSVSPNSCTVTVGQISQVFRNQTPGLVPADVQNIRIESFFGGSTTPIRSVTCATLTACLSNTTVFPSGDTGGNYKGGEVGISAWYRFPSAISLFWPGAGPGRAYGVLMLPANAREAVRY